MLAASRVTALSRRYYAFSARVNEKTALSGRESVEVRVLSADVPIQGHGYLEIVNPVGFRAVQPACTNIHLYGR